MMPDATREIASGMNMTSRTAAAHRIRSVSTASTSPIVVTSVGATRTQITLLRSATNVRSSVNAAT
jgi:hypothetical protein